jgi:hypothetical protein
VAIGERLEDAFELDDLVLAQAWRSERGAALDYRERRCHALHISKTLDMQARVLYRPGIASKNLDS